MNVLTRPAHDDTPAALSRIVPPIPAGMPEPPARIARRSRRRAVFSVIGGLLIWEFVGRYVVTNPILFAPFSKVVMAGWGLLISGELQRHLAVSSIEFLIGFGLATLVGVALGFLMATNRFAHDVLDPWVSFFYSSPLVALIPFFILVFGVGISSKVAIIFTVAIFPILLNAFVGVRSANADLLEVGAAFNCTRAQIFTKILFPAALPFVIVGLRLGIGRALTGVVVSELFGSTAGLGWLIGTAGQSFDTPTVLFGVLMFSTIGVAMVEGLKWVERLLAPWRKSVQDIR
ncbi:MAG TPA: ABC transporter permease [Xanthobacteraceae bacterium]|nr:ABC transporter permease [Xanthobacteraceae bacterium]